MTNKEYKKLRESYEYYSGYDYLTREERSELYHDIKERVSEGEIYLEGSNNRATEKAILEDDCSLTYILTSYYTDVCSYNTKTGEFKKLWCGYSNTTLKHINLFRARHYLDTITKREWICL